MSSSTRRSSDSSSGRRWGGWCGFVEQFGGHVKEIAGDGLLALFGAPVVHEDDAERAVRSALELFHEADRLAVADQVAVIPLWNASNVTYIKPGVEGWWEFGKTWPNFADWWSPRSDCAPQSPTRSRISRLGLAKK